MAFSKRIIVERHSRKRLNDASNDHLPSKHIRPDQLIDDYSSKLFTRLKHRPSFLNNLRRKEYYLNCYWDVSVNNTNHSLNVVDYLSSRTTGNVNLQNARLSSDFGLKRMLENDLFREKDFTLENMKFKLNKIFSSQWLNDRQVIFGTKCNQLGIIDVYTSKIHLIPTLKTNSPKSRTHSSCGIHSIELNPSKTLLATGAENPNDIAVYKLPTMDPVCVGERAHKDWIFDITWLDDEFLVTGSRDSHIALWRVNSKDHLDPICYDHMESILIKNCVNAEKIRALLFNEKQKELAILSLNAHLHLFDVETFQQKHSTELTYKHENVCLSKELDKNLYAVGSKSHVTFLDSRSYQTIEQIPSKYNESGIRSLNFYSDLLTIGTGSGAILFFDIRKMNYLDNRKGTIVLKTTNGWEDYENTDELVFLASDQSGPAIYTHQIDSSKTRIFAAGGPLPASHQGNYAALWS